MTTILLYPLKLFVHVKYKNVVLVLFIRAHNNNYY